MAQLQTYLRDSLQKNTLDQVCNNINIKYSRHCNYPNLVLFKYKNILVDFSNVCTCQARGIILNENDNWNIVSYPYDKFFNYGEKYAATINWDNINVYEKLDGCLMTMFYYGDKWLVSSSGKPDASGITSTDKNMTLGQVFWEIWNNNNYVLPQDVNLCYMFELLTDKNPVKIKYLTNDIILHGARNIKTFEEFLPGDIAKFYNWKSIQVHNISNNIDTIVDFVNQRSGFNYEGLVICDNNFNRLKIKSKEYFTNVYFLSNNNKKYETCKKKIFELSITNNTNDLNELLAAFPDFVQVNEGIDKQIAITIDKIQKNYDDIKHLVEDRKQFAQESLKSSYSTVLFLMRNKAMNPRECLEKLGYDYFDKINKMP